jgi:hypothetical protein
MFTLLSIVIMYTNLISFFYFLFLIMTVPTTATPSFRPTPAPTGKPSTAQPSSQPTSHPTSPSGIYRMPCRCHADTIWIISQYIMLSCATCRDCDAPHAVYYIMYTLYRIPYTIYCIQGSLLVAHPASPPAGHLAGPLVNLHRLLLTWSIKR